MPDCDLLIIGAGIAGLSMAHYAAEAGLKVLVLERESRPGGCLHSHRFNKASTEFWLELGAHSAFNSYGNLIAILESLQALDCLIKRAKVGFRLYADGTVRSMPSQMDIPELVLATFRLLGLIKVGRSVADYYGRIVGRRNYTRVFGPAFDAVICQPASDYPADSLFQSRPRRKDIPRGFAFSGGMQTITDTLAGRSGVRVELGQTVRGIQRGGKDFVVKAGDAHYTAPRVCLATSVAVATELLRSMFPAVAAQLAEIETATVETVGVALPAEQVRLPPLAGLIGRGEPFYSAVSRDTVPDAQWRGFTFHFRPGVLGDEEKLNRIAHVLKIPRTALSLENVVSKINQLPSLRVGHGERTGHVDALLAGTGLALSGNYFTGVALEDCVTRSRAEFERLRREGL